MNGNLTALDKSRTGFAMSVKVHEYLFLSFQVVTCTNRSLIFQDGQIDYGEFAAMMRKGNEGMGRRTMRSKINLEDAL